MNLLRAPSLRRAHRVPSRFGVDAWGGEVRLLVACALAGLSLVAPHTATADGDIAGGIDVQLRLPVEVSYDAKSLGRVVLPFRLTVTNRDPEPARLPRGLQFVARNTLATYPCEGRTRDEERWPSSLAPGASVSAERTVTCETDLPGPHTLEVRWANANPRTPALGASAFVVAPGADAPVPLSTRPGFRAIASSTREASPSREPGKVRVVLGLVNATASAAQLPNVAVAMTVRMRDAGVKCQDRRVVDLTGSLNPGQMHVVWMPVGCAFADEGIWDVLVDVGEPGAPPVRLPPVAVRIASVTAPPQTPSF